MDSNQELLKNEKWLERRNQILKRDNYTCKMCTRNRKTEIDYLWIDKDGINWGQSYKQGSFELFEWYYDPKTGEGSSTSYDLDFPLPNITLNVHHKRYILNKNPWEYEDEDLETLCQNCHEKWHNNNIAYLFDESGNKVKSLRKCQKCNGSGYIYKFYYHMNGVCFDCFGEGIVFDS